MPNQVEHIEAPEYLPDQGKELSRQAYLKIIKKKDIPHYCSECDQEHKFATLKAKPRASP